MSHGSMRHIVLNHIDSPLKILFWTRGELMTFLIPFFGGLLLDAFLMGSVTAMGASWVRARGRDDLGKGRFQAVCYFYGLKQLKASPPSFIHEFLG